VVLPTAGVVLYLLIGEALVAEFDASLQAEARALVGLIEQEDGELESDLAERGLDRFARSDRPQYYELWGRDGRVIERSQRLESKTQLYVPQSLAHPEYRWVQLPDGRPGRLIGFPFTPFDEDHQAAARSTEESAELNPATASGRLVLVLARDTLELDGALRRIKVLLTVVFAGAVVLSLLVTAPLVQMGLRPLETTSTRIEQISEGNLSVRVDAANAPAEVSAVVECLNRLLARLEAAFERERAFSANVAHELNTPLAGLRSTLEVARSRPREPADYQKTLDDCLAICVQTEAIVANLLSLARIDAGQCEVHSEEVPLGRLIDEAWSAWAERAKSRGLKVTRSVDETLSVRSDPEKLRLILHNLLQNAVVYADEGGTIDITTAGHPDRVEIAITNSGNSLSPGETKQVFERFWRGDPARGATGRHAGLGLALCKELAELLNASLAIKSLAGGLFEVRMELGTA
jgi:two-component system sensor histidine kinase QseC